jgi:hypothetical protein
VSLFISFFIYFLFTVLFQTEETDEKKAKINFVQHLISSLAPTEEEEELFVSIDDCVNEWYDKLS